MPGYGATILVMPAASSNQDPLVVVPRSRRARHVHSEPALLQVLQVRAGKDTPDNVGTIPP